MPRAGLPGDGPPPAVPHPSGGAAGGLICPACQTPNSAGMNFCRSCGSRLRAPSKPEPAGRMPSAADVVGRQTPRSAVPAVKVSCRHCGADTPSGFKFCQQCGKPLARTDAEALAQASTDPAEPKRSAPARDSRPPGVRGGSRGVPLPDAVAETLAATGTDAAGIIAEAAELARRRTLPEDPAIVSTLPETPFEETGLADPAARSGSGRAKADGPAWGRLVVVRQDGADGAAFPLAGDVVEIGRDGGGPSFENDRYLAPVHARIERAGGKVRIVPVDRVNGVFRRLTASTRLVGGDALLMGRELLRFELVDEDERAAPPLVQGGVVRFGTPSREPWGRLSLVLASGGARDVRYLSQRQIVIGREEGDIVFRDDEFLSRRHAMLQFEAGRCTVQDLDSSNGTYVRLREAAEVAHRDFIRVGNQLFRIELGS